MQEFYFIYTKDKGTVYHAVLKGTKYIISWEGEDRTTSYEENIVKELIKNKDWIIINDTIETEDF